MKKSKTILVTGFALLIGLPGYGQEKALTVKANFRYDSPSSLPSIVSAVEVNALLARVGMVGDRVYSSNGRIEAKIEMPLNRDSYLGHFDYDVSFTDLSSGKYLGKFKVGGRVIPASDGKHFVTFDSEGGRVRFYSFESNQQLHSLVGADDVQLSGDGSTVLVTKTGGYSVFTEAFSIEGKQLWSKEVPNATFHDTAINYDGKIAAISVKLFEPQKAEQEKTNSKKIAEARSQWLKANLRRRAQGLPDTIFVKPEIPVVEWNKIGNLSQPSRCIIFLDPSGFEIGRSPSSTHAFSDLAFSRDGGNLLVASTGRDFHLFDAARSLLLQNQNLEPIESVGPAVEIYSLDVDQSGSVVMATIDHPTKLRGGFVDRGLSDPRMIILWNAPTSETKIYKLDSNLQIPKDQFVVTISAGKLLAKAGEDVFVFEK